MWWTKSRRAQNVDDYETWISGGIVPTLNVFDNASETRATVLIIDGTRVNDVRVYEDGIVPTVVARYGTGGGNVPMVFDNSAEIETIAFDTQFGSNANTFENVSPTLKASQQPPSFLNSNVYPIQNTVIGRADENGPGGKGYKDDGEPMFTVDTTSPHAIAENKTVRRLTPIECERLQGFPDDWTSGQADSNRYKQMGNAVAVPVVEWIINRMVGQLNGEPIE